MSESDTSKVVFNFIKSPAYRSAHIDGAFGGVTPRGKISMVLFSERLAIPTRTVHETDGNKLGDEISRDSREGIIRELEMNCMIDKETARAIADWLNKKASELEEIMMEKQKNDSGN